MRRWIASNNLVKVTCVHIAIEATKRRIHDKVRKIEGIDEWNGVFANVTTKFEDLKKVKEGNRVVASITRLLTMSICAGKK